jgi:hypothetical protein
MPTLGTRASLGPTGACDTGKPTGPTKPRSNWRPTWIPGSGRPRPLGAARSYGYARQWGRSRRTYGPTPPAWSTTPGATCSGQRISTAAVESMVNRVIGRRLAKKQPMRWSRRGAHLLVQIRVTVLDGRLPHLFQRGYPHFEPAGTRHRLTPPRGLFHFRRWLTPKSERPACAAVDNLRFILVPTRKWVG